MFSTFVNKCFKRFVVKKMFNSLFVIGLSGGEIIFPTPLIIFPMIIIWLFGFDFGLKLFCMVNNEIILKKICQKMQNYAKKSSLKIWFNRILDRNAMKMDCIYNATNLI